MIPSPHSLRSPVLRYGPGRPLADCAYKDYPLRGRDLENLVYAPVIGVDKRGTRPSLESRLGSMVAAQRAFSPEYRVQPGPTAGGTSTSPPRLEQRSGPLGPPDHHGQFLPTAHSRCVG